MTTETYYARTITQISTSSSQNWINLNNTKNTTSSYSQCGSSTIAGKNGTRKKPSVIKFTNFGISLPTGAEVSKITVEYAHSKVTYKGATPNIPAPTITLLNVSGQSGKGVAPTTTMIANKKEFSFTPTNSKITSSSFGVQFDYPANTNTNPGYMRIKYVRIIITYKAPSFTLTSKKLDSNLTVGDETKISLTLNNTNKTTYSPNVSITLPGNVTLVNNNGNATLSGSTLTWKPSLSKRPASVTLSITLRITSAASGTISSVESLTHKTSTLSFTSVAAPVTPVVTEEELEPVQDITLPDLKPTTVNKGDTFELTFPKPNVDSSTWSGYSNSQVIYAIKESTTGAFKCVVGNSEVSNYSSSIIKRILKSDYASTDTVTLKFKAKTGGYNEIWVYTLGTTDRTQQIPYDVVPDNLTTPLLSFCKIEGEELSRLGDKQRYTVAANLKVITETDEPTLSGAIVTDYVRDWRKNFRIGVCNTSLPDNPTVTDIFNGVENWSSSISEVDTWEYKETDFIYHEEYPLYIVFTSDFAEGYPDTSYLVYTSPIIVESDVYAGYEKTGNYPIPFSNCIIAEDTANLTIPTFASSSPIVVYDFPVEDLGTDEDYAVMGIQLTIDCAYSDELSLTAQLRDANGKIGSRSIIINNSTNEDIVLGSIYDRWGFEGSEFVDLKDWEIILIVNNLFNNETGAGDIIFNNIQVSFFTQKVEEADIICKVEDEDTRWYGMFLRDVNIPFGLETTTKFIDIDGSDNHDAGRQNVESKELELEFDIGGCLIEDSTMMMRNLAKLLQNKRDSLDNVIPKKIWFSHLPDLYFEYVMKDSIDASIAISDYTGKLKLVVPSGTAYSLYDTVTNSTGSVVGMTKVPCKIVFIPLSDTIAIEEENSGKKFSITYSDWDSTKLVEIDTKEQTILLKNSEDDINPIDITYAGDFNNDWFVLHGDYNFKPSNCIIQSVTFNDRW